MRLVQLGAVKVVFGHFLGTYKFLLGGGQSHVAHRIILKRNAAYFIANLSQNIEFHDDLVQVCCQHFEFSFIFFFDIIVSSVVCSVGA